MLFIFCLCKILHGTTVLSSMVSVQSKSGILCGKIGIIRVFLNIHGSRREEHAGHKKLYDYGGGLRGGAADRHCRAAACEAAAVLPAGSGRRVGGLSGKYGAGCGAHPGGSGPEFVQYADINGISDAGYAILSYASGYNGDNKVLVGFNEDATEITGIVVTSQAETPGLGAKIVEADFRKQFENKSSVVELSAVKGIKAEEALDGQIAAISGATISSTSVVNAVNSARNEAINLFLK